MSSTKKGLIGCLGCMGLLALAGVVAVLVVIGRSNNELQAELDLGRKQGIYRENDVREPVPDDDNAMVAVKPLLTEKVSAAPNNFDGSPNWLAANATEFGRLRQIFIDASLKPKFAQTVDYKKRGVMYEYQDLTDAKHIVRFLAVDGRRRIGNGDPSGIESFRAAARWATLVRQEPLFLAMMAGISCETNIVNSVGRTLQENPSSVLATQAVRDVLQMISPPIDIKHVAAGEYNILRFAHESVKDPAIRKELQSAENHEEDLSFYEYVDVPFLDNAILAEGLRGYRKLHAALPEDPTDLDAVEETLFQSLGPGASNFFSTYASYLNVFSDPEEILAALRRRVARQRVLDSMLAVVENRAVNGRIPATLPPGKLGGKDPFTGEPLMYEVTGSKVRVWSVGPNGTDDSGIKSADNDDIVLAIIF
jgi:hypothetical protein